VQDAEEEEFGRLERQIRLEVGEDFSGLLLHEVRSVKCVHCTCVPSGRPLFKAVATALQDAASGVNWLSGLHLATVLVCLATMSCHNLTMGGVLESADRL
jgi:hypothetical protein